MKEIVLEEVDIDGFYKTTEENSKIIEKEKKTYYKYLDILRIFACAAVLFYHLNILKGGYLAVCSFFVLSGYLSCISAFRKENFSIWGYYKNRLLRIYLPLVVVVFISILVITLFFKDVTLIYLKRETLSVVFGYNNFWQLGARLDYFARHTDSPFIHLWYTAILLQLELIFPFLFLALKKLGDGIHKSIPIIIASILATVSAAFFYKVNMEAGRMGAYYNTFARAFSWLFGLSLGFIHSYYKPLIIHKLKGDIIGRILFFFYLTALAFLCICIDTNSGYFAVSMIAATLLTLRLIDFGALFPGEALFPLDKCVKAVSSISYEIYLIQYPIIFIFQNINAISFLKPLFSIFFLLLAAFLVHFAFMKKGKYKIIQIILMICFLSLSLHGIYQYIVTEDYQAEMTKLETELTQNEILLEQKLLADRFIAWREEVVQALFQPKQLCALLAQSGQETLDYAHKKEAEAAALKAQQEAEAAELARQQAEAEAWRKQQEQAALLAQQEQAAAQQAAEEQAAAEQVAAQQAAAGQIPAGGSVGETGNQGGSLEETMRNLQIVGVGDSVMLGAVANLYSLFPNGHFDAKVSRSGQAMRDILQDLKNNNQLGNPVVIHAGTNGDCSIACKDSIMQICEGRPVFWLTITNDETMHVNDGLKEYAGRYPNLHIIDWCAISAGHPEYFYKDGIHLTPAGRSAYAEAVYWAIYKVYAGQ